MNFRPLSPPSHPAQLFPSCCFLSEAGFLSSHVLWFGLGQSGMVSRELLGSKAGVVWGGQPCGRALTAESPPLPWPGRAQTHAQGTLDAIPKTASILERAGTIKWAPRSSSSPPTWSPQQSAPEPAVLQMANSWPCQVVARCGRHGSRLAPPGRGCCTGTVLGAGTQGRNVCG